MSYEEKDGGGWGGGLPTKVDQNHHCKSEITGADDAVAGCNNRTVARPAI